ncbi:MAG TPA: 16S rRNA (cytosine(1402)-N(4))-methyltransferase RsmH [Clostridia bacterium]|nr:16S rRNA (cytosine(1402)-N(4))-methyltransferase RsmH [Clostridia bacterium]
MGFQHIPVLLEEVLEYLAPQPGEVYVDATLGGAGHGAEILKRIIPSGFLIGIDRDREALEKAERILAGVAGDYQVFHGNYQEISSIVRETQITAVDGILFDLGVSSFQLDDQDRGFSYQKDAPLDMRMNPLEGVSARAIVNTWSEKELGEMIFSYGEERWAKRIASFIVGARETRPVETTGQLVEIIKAAIPAAARRSGPHPAKRTFQALRIAVNDELGGLARTLPQAVRLLKPGGRLSVITFHSLEDRIVKRTLQKMAALCTCPPGLPQCRCGQQRVVKIVTRKPVLPSDREIRENPRARSAKLRVAEKL